MALVVDMDAAPNIRLLKTVVIVLGVLIVIGVGVLVTTIAQRLSRMAADSAAEPEVSAAAPAARPFGDRRLALPAGSRVIEMATGDGRLYLRLAGPGGGQVLVLDPATGERLGSFAWEAVP